MEYKIGSNAAYFAVRNFRPSGIEISYPHSSWNNSNLSFFSLKPNFHHFACKNSFASKSFWNITNYNGGLTQGKQKIRRWDESWPTLDAYGSIDEHWVGQGGVFHCVTRPCPKNWAEIYKNPNINTLMLVRTTFKGSQGYFNACND